MEISGKVAVITGAASGIGRALALRFHQEGAKAVIVADQQVEALQQVAEETAGLAVPTDVARETDIENLVKKTLDAHGTLDIFVSNAGIARLGSETAPDTEWQLNWDIHVMAHVYAARHALPVMLAKGGGYLVNTASAAGLLTHVNSATYSVTKHGAVAFAEYLTINYGQRGIRVSVLCPQAVRTAMTSGREGQVASVDGMLEPEELADCVVDTMAKESFLILPHPIVATYMQRKTADYDRWIAGMRRLKDKFLSKP